MRIVLLLLCTVCAAYTVFVYTRGDAGGDKKPTSAARAGMDVWQQKNCQSCHQIYGLGGYMGPDLTNAAAKGDSYLRAFISNGTERMPNFHLSAAEVDELCAFLHWVDATGKSKVPAAAVHWTGSYKLQP
jgi:nitric oxide reductase subunit C